MQRGAPAARASRQSPAEKPVSGEAIRVRVPERLHLEASVRADTLDEGSRTVEIIWAAGAPVKRYDWCEGGYYIEELSMEPGAIRTDRFEAGMSLLDSHSSYSMSDRLGTVVPGSVRIEGGKGYATVRFSKSEAAETIFRDLIDGHPFPVSVGYRTHAYEKTEGDETSLPVLRAIDWEPFELSAVPIPADPAAHSLRGEDAGSIIDVEVRRPNTGATKRNGEDEMPQSNRTGKKPLKNGNPNGQRSETEGGEGEEEEGETEGEGSGEGAEGEESTEGEGEGQGTEGEGERRQPAQRRSQPSGGQRQQPQSSRTRQNTSAPNAEEVRRAAAEAVANERTRTQEIRDMGTRTGMTEDMIRQHVDGGSTLDEFRTIVFDQMATRQEAAGIFPHTSRNRDSLDATQTRRDAAVNAIMHRHGVAPTLTDAAREQGFRNMPVMDIAREILRENGESTRGSVNEVCARALHSTSDFPAILGDVTRQTILAGYQGYENTYQLFSTRNVVSDFREVKVLELGDNPDLLKVNEHGEFKRGTMRENEEGFRIATYGRVIGLTRQMIINDHLGAFTQAASNWGRKVAKLEGDLVWGQILANVMLKDNTPVFDVSRGNKAATGTYLTSDELAKARTAWRKLKDIDGEPINLPPKFLFVGSELEIPAQKIITGVTAPQTTAQVVPEAIRSLQPVYEYRMDLLGPYAYLLLADPAATGGRGIQHAYLAGQETPFTESRVGFDVDGIEHKVRHDFGAGVTDWRFGYLNSGAAPS